MVPVNALDPDLREKLNALPESLRVDLLEFLGSAHASVESAQKMIEESIKRRISEKKIAN
jgi:hypothetical protein